MPPSNLQCSPPNRGLGFPSNCDPLLHQIPGVHLLASLLSPLAMRSARRPKGVATRLDKVSLGTRVHVDFGQRGRATSIYIPRHLPAHCLLNKVAIVVIDHARGHATRHRARKTVVRIAIFQVCTSIELISPLEGILQILID